MVSVITLPISFPPFFFLLQTSDIRRKLYKYLVLAFFLSFLLLIGSQSALCAFPASAVDDSAACIAASWQNNYGQVSET